MIYRHLVRRLRRGLITRFQPSLRTLLSFFNVQVSGILHIGANVGQEAPLYASLTNGPVFHIEGDPRTFSTLKSALEAFPGQIAINALCCDKETSGVRFFRAANDGASSSILEPSGHLKVHPFVEFTESIDLPGTTLDNLASGYAEMSRCNLLVVDVQGADLLVLRGGEKFIRKNIDVIYVEVGIELYRSGAPAAEIVGFLSDCGFELRHVFVHMQNSGDAFFLRREECRDIYKDAKTAIQSPLR